MATVNDILRVTLAGTMSNLDVWNNVYHYKVISGGETDYDVIVAAIEAHFDNAYANVEAVLHQDVETTDIIVSEWDFTAHEWDGKAQSSAACLDGSVNTDALPNGNAIVVRFFTDELRRQARKFLPGIPEANTVLNNITAGTATAAVNFAADIVSDITAGGATLTPCTFNDTPTSVRYETDSLFTGDYFVNTGVGYQRRRQPGAGI